MLMALLLTLAGALLAGAAAYWLRRRRLTAGHEALLAEPSRASRVLVLGPAGAGKTTMLRHALRQFARGASRRSSAVTAQLGGPYAPTRGLVIVDANVRGLGVQLCDAGGGDAERRQWIALVRGADVRAIVYVLDSADDSELGRDLFRQLALAPWAAGARLFVALNVRSADGDDAACARREAELRAAVPKPFGVVRLSALHDSSAAVELIAEAAAAGEG